MNALIYYEITNTTSLMSKELWSILKFHTLNFSKWFQASQSTYSIWHKHHMKTLSRHTLEPLLL